MVNGVTKIFFYCGDFEEWSVDIYIKNLFVHSQRLLVYVDWLASRSTFVLLCYNYDPLTDNALEAFDFPLLPHNDILHSMNCSKQFDFIFSTSPSKTFLGVVVSFENIEALLLILILFQYHMSSDQFAENQQATGKESRKKGIFFKCPPASEMQIKILGFLSCMAQCNNICPFM